MLSSAKKDDADEEIAKYDGTYTPVTTRDAALMAAVAES